MHRAPWIMTGLSGSNMAGQCVVADGALVVADGRIKAIGPYREIVKYYGGCQLFDHENLILAPPLINSHCHLELSYLDLAGKAGGSSRYEGDTPAWIRDLLREKARFHTDTADAEAIARARSRQHLQHMYAEGVAFVGDIGNSLASKDIGLDDEATVFFLLELLGLSAESAARGFARLEEVSGSGSPAVACTAHAPYSTAPELIREIKKKADLQNHVFSIHIAESLPEVKFLQKGTGRFREFLEEIGVWDGTFVIPGQSPVHYLESLGVLNRRTLCVHAVHVSREEIGTLARTGAHVCLCPGSNRFLGVGKAPVTEFLDHGILPALGTDSRASNPVLSMWREMRLLREDHPGLHPVYVFAMATRGGAAAWGIDTELGTLEVGKLAQVIAVACNARITSGEDAFEFMTTVGESAQVTWAGRGYEHAG